VPVCWLTSDLRYVVKSLVPVSGTRELPTYLRSEVNRQTGTRKYPTDLRSEANQQTGSRELASVYKSLI
jgi:hypothetical protein